MGQIKLQVKNIRGERVSVNRSMKVFYRRGKYTFETTDATMNYINVLDNKFNSNNTESISKRCIDVDVAMCQFMGVSKAIINNVLFCHQEDSSWPLDEAKKLKEKFDAIFGITEYNKAIERIIKMRKDKMTDLKVKDEKLRLLAHLKQEMEDKTLSLTRAEQKCEALNDQIANCNLEMKPIDGRLLEIRKIEYEVGKYQSLKTEMDTNLKNVQEQVVNLSRKIKKLFEGDLSEIELEIKNFNQRMSHKNIERNKIEKRISDFRTEEKILQKISGELNKEHCKLVLKHLKEEESKSKLIDNMKALCIQLNIEDNCNLNADLGNINELLEAIQNSLMCLECQIAETRTEYEEDDQERQVKIDALRVETTKLEERIVTMKKQKDNLQNELKSLTQKIKEVEIATQHLSKLTNEIERIEEYYETMSGKFNQDNMRQVINQGKEKVTQLQEKFRLLDERLTFLNSISKLMTEISLKGKELEKKELAVRRVKSKHSDNFKKVFSTPVEINYRRALQAAYEKLRREIKDLHEKENSLRKQQQLLEIERKNVKEEIVRFEKDLEESNEKVFEKCRSTPYEDLVAKCKTTIHKLQLDHGALRSAEAMYKKYIKKIEDDPCCPLCHKGLSTNEAADVTTELVDEIDQLPDNIKRTENILKTEQNKYENLLKLKSVIENVSRLEIDLPKRKLELKEIEVKLADCTNEIDSLQMIQAEPTFNLELTNSMMGDMTLLDEAIKEITRLKEDLEKLKNKLPQDYDSNESADDVQTEKNKAFEDLEMERNSLEKNQHDYEKYTEALNNLREKKNALKDEQIKLQEGLQSLPQLKDREEELLELIETTNVEIQISQSKIHPLSEKLKSAIDDKAAHKENNRKKLDQVKKKYDGHKTDEKEVTRLHKEVVEYQLLNLDVKIARSQEELEKKKREIEEKENEIDKTTEELDVIKTECLNQKALERDLNDNKELIMLKCKEIDLAKQNEELCQQLGDLDIHKVLKEKSNLIAKRDEGTVRKGELLGQVGEVKNQINAIKKEIDSPKYKNAVKNYRRSFYEVEIIRRIIADLGQYRVSLEWSLMQFHSEKMEKINKLIREYWRLIYRGNDIDYIQIQTDDISTDSSIDRRRNYNYRVIQSKNNSEIEMRGRCSAGQRVLASLIIRMALAETFSSNCGVLALDEPTTNLDRHNIISLCEALNRIVEERQTQSNFMLIIITHDEEFISTLGKINTYYRVFRNDECKSVIRKVKVT